MKLRVYIFQNVSRILLTLFLFTLVGCDKEIERLDNFLVDFATVFKQNNNYIFKLDDGTLLTPDGSFNFDGDTGDRVILNWIPSEDNIVKINRASSIYTGKIQIEGYPSQYKNDPIKIQSVWVSGDYINMVFEIEYHSVPHSIAILRDMQSQTVDLYFAHTTNNDPEGYPQIMYASFLISNLRDEDNTVDIPFNFYINTNTGTRRFQFQLK
jgi:hypothetical protein